MGRVSCARVMLVCIIYLHAEKLVEDSKENSYSIKVQKSDMGQGLGYFAFAE